MQIDLGWGEWVQFVSRNGTPVSNYLKKILLSTTATQGPYVGTLRRLGPKAATGF